VHRIVHYGKAGRFPRHVSAVSAKRTVSALFSENSPDRKSVITSFVYCTIFRTKVQSFEDFSSETLCGCDSSELLSETFSPRDSVQPRQAMQLCPQSELLFSSPSSLLPLRVMRKKYTSRAAQ
jgi:hypothetical protein